MGNTPDAYRRGRAGERFTPTRVGNTWPSAAPSTPPAVHPHTRGEYCQPRGQPGHALGSPPHAWGILHTGASPCLALPVHPHTRGEYAFCQKGRAAASGSPPHAWGIRRASLRSMWPRRFTPTRVGNTPAGTLSAIAKSGSPPHAWGIRLSVTNCTPVPSGSPPHAWGILHSLGVSVRGWPVHPHTRGEYSCRCRWSSTLSRFTPTRVGNTTYRIQLIPMTIGSPPHAWGIRGLEVQEGVGDRFTPTRVGNTRGYCPPVRPASRFTPTRVGNTDSAPASAT